MTDELVCRICVIVVDEVNNVSRLAPPFLRTWSREDKAWQNYYSKVEHEGYMYHLTSLSCQCHGCDMYLMHYIITSSFILAHGRSTARVCRA